MKLSNTSLIKGLSVKESIVAAINEMFNERASADFINSLVVEGFVGSCIEVEEKGDSTYTYTSKSYFVATQVLVLTLFVLITAVSLNWYGTNNDSK